MTQAFHQDCMTAMKEFPDKYFELAIVDPPYGIGDFNQKRSRNFHKEITWNNDIPTEQYFSELHRISKNQIIFGAEYYAKFIDSPGRIIHDKTGGPQNAKQFDELSDVDIASHSFGVNHKVFHYTWRGNVQGDKINWKNTGSDERIHPCQKPLALYRWILNRYAKPGDKILDTHLGSGSSRIAADQMGFDFWGYELDRDYFEAQEKRFSQYKSQLTMFK